MTRIFLLDGHPDPSPERFCAALADAYAAGARRSGHEVRRFDLGSMNFPLLRTREDFARAPLPDDSARVQDALRWADHIVIIHPIWIGSPPALLRALFEQVFRLGFVLSQPDDKAPKKILKGKSAHVVTTLGMSAFAYRWLFGTQGVRGLTKGLLRFAGVKPVRRTLVGAIDGTSDRRKWLTRMQEAGARAR
ncbi:MAG TPA: NAD(P)H-dependent oxidoreductase [Rhizomicrobium sp.]|nr:NAD(P)H-dependent oxidoreductase [Rhizomicrobium sp.]